MSALEQIGLAALRQIDPERAHGLALKALRAGLAPMPGVVVSVAFKPGDAVKEGQPLLVIESMKLETTLSAPRDGVIAEMPFAAGDSFGLKAVLAQLAPEEK